MIQLISSWNLLVACSDLFSPWWHQATINIQYSCVNIFDFHHWNLEWTHSDQLVRFKPFRIVIGIFFIYRTVNCCWQVPWFEVWKTQQLARTYQYKHFENSFIFKNLNIWIFLLQYSETEISYIITFVSFLNTMQHILYFQEQLVLYSVYTSTIYSYYAVESLAHCLFMHIITM